MNLHPAVVLLIAAFASAVHESGAAVPTPATPPSHVAAPGHSRLPIAARATRVHHLAFRRGALAQVTVRGSGASDLDVHVFDQDGHHVAQDSGFTDFCTLSWIARDGRAYRIEVRNVGAAGSEYTLESNGTAAPQCLLPISSTCRRTERR
jgi:hypothetical protein